LVVGIADSLTYLAGGAGPYPAAGLTSTNTGYEARDTESIMIVQDAANNFDLLVTHDSSADTDGFNFQLQVLINSSCSAQTRTCSAPFFNSSVLAAAYQNTPFRVGSGLPPQACEITSPQSWSQFQSRGACCAATGSCCGASQVCGQFDQCTGAGTFYAQKRWDPQSPSTANAALWLGHLPTSNDWCITLEYTHLASATGTWLVCWLGEGGG
jgi:hypothetical protein